MLIVSWCIGARWSAVALAALAFSATVVMPLGPPSAQGLDFREPGDAPPSWIQFAKVVKSHFEEWIAADEVVANRFRAYVSERASKDDGPPQMLVVRAWLNPNGSVERVSFPSLKDPRASEDLRAILTRGNVGKAPPVEMLQPLNLRLSLNFKK